ncbi:MAG: N-acetylmuramic acid 6-phosphate etherase [Erysipelotrichaceae bacterium]|nr:N-acetylmuramic acid 6-phosphate etherase [Erysipelotrichaceae bacterium]
MTEKLNTLSTEGRNPRSMDLDKMSPLEIVSLMNDEDNRVIEGVKAQLPNISKGVELMTQTIKNGGRVLYFGAGTSGRLGVLDASECMPTFGTKDEVQGIMAGGDYALRNAVEGIEDSETAIIEDLKKLNANSKDCFVAIAASGRTPYCISGLKYAKELGAKSIAISANPNSKMSAFADVSIDVFIGQEVLTGSTRLKSGTAQKMVLNMLSTATMVGLGKVYSNLMVDVIPVNIKLFDRAKRIVMNATECTLEVAEKALEETNMRPKPAIVMIKTGCSKEEAFKRLEKAEGFIRKAIL